MNWKTDLRKLSSKRLLPIKRKHVYGKREIRSSRRKNENGGEAILKEITKKSPELIKDIKFSDNNKHIWAHGLKLENNKDKKILIHSNEED